MKFTVSIPPPGQACSPNCKSRWLKSKDGKDSRYAAKLMALAAKPPSWQKARWTFTWVIGKLDGTYRPKDEQNAAAALKWAIDGIVGDAKLLPDDSAKHLKFGGGDIVNVKGAKSYVEIEFEEIPDE